MSVIKVLGRKGGPDPIYGIGLDAAGDLRLLQEGLVIQGDGTVFPYKTDDLTWSRLTPVRIVSIEVEEV